MLIRKQWTYRTLRHFEMNFFSPPCLSSQHTTFLKRLITSDVRLEKASNFYPLTLFTPSNTERTLK